MFFFLIVCSSTPFTYHGCHYFFLSFVPPQDIEQFYSTQIDEMPMNVADLI